MDIEGTTTPISFVHDVLFPYARANAQSLLNEADIIALQREHAADLAAGMNPPPWDHGPIQYVYWLMDNDRKSTALKELQGRVWEIGYGKGDLHGEVFEDVPLALNRWAKGGKDVRIYSSGSVLAQRLIFSTTPQGDLTRFIRGYFDTTSGPKGEPSSYTRIASGFGLAPRDILFLSDVVRELDAAQAAGFQTALSIRPGNLPQPANQYRTIRTFDEVELLEEA